MRIREFFHLIHIVDDEDEVDAFYDELFAPQRFRTKHWFDMEKRWASLSMVSDLMLEVIEPSGEESDRQLPLPKFRHRFGQHYHSLAWYVDAGDVRPLFDRLRDRGVRVAKPGGGMFPAGDIDPGNTLFTTRRTPSGSWNSRARAATGSAEIRGFSRVGRPPRGVRDPWGSNDFRT